MNRKKWYQINWVLRRKAFKTMTTGRIFIIFYTKLPRVGGWITFHIRVHLTPILRSWTPFIDFHLIGQVLAGGTYFSLKGTGTLKFFQSDGNGMDYATFFVIIIIILVMVMIIVIVKSKNQGSALWSPFTAMVMAPITCHHWGWQAGNNGQCG